MTRQPARAEIPRRRFGWRMGLQDRLLASIGCLIAASVLFTAAASAEHAVLALGEAAGDQADSAEWREARTLILRGVGATSLAALAVMLPLVYVLIARAFAPLRQLSRASRLVAEGQFHTVDLTRRSGDALGELAETFNAMVLRLREQKRLADDAAAKLLENNLNLEATIADRTRELEATASRLRGEIHEKGDFFRAVSHDLNAPLRNIDGMVTSVLRKHGDQLPDDAKRRLERVRHNVAIEGELIGEVLELSRIKTAGGDREDVRVGDVIWELRGVFEQDLRDNGIELTVESQLPVIHAERVRVRQVFQNLIDNAIKYMGVGHDRRIRIRCGDVENAVEFQVIDTGIGITPDEAERVFYAFRRGTNHTGIAGKGVGLAGVKAIVETYDGTIRCEPGEAIGQPGGTVFRFTIDRRHVGPKPAAARADDSGGGLVADADAHFDGVANEDPAARPGVARAA